MATTALTTAWTPDDPTPRPLLSALDGLGGSDLITFVGAGGKTTLLHALGRALAATGARVVLTTTTKMAPDPALATPDAALAHLDAARAAGRGASVLVGTPVATREGEKIGPLDDAAFARVRAAADVVLVEGDGSRRLPFKVPAGYEPVVPAETGLLVIVAGLTALGRPLADVCCRAERVPTLMADGAEPADAQTWATRPLDDALAAELLRRGYLDNPRLAAWRDRRVVILNQADDARAAHAGALTTLPGERVLLATTDPEGRR